MKKKIDKSKDQQIREAARKINIKARKARNNGKWYFRAKRTPDGYWILTPQKGMSDNEAREDLVEGVRTVILKIAGCIFSKHQNNSQLPPDDDLVPETSQLAPSWFSEPLVRYACKIVRKVWPQLLRLRDNNRPNWKGEGF